MVQEYDTSKYEFAIRETRTAEVISDVSTMKSEIGVLYLCDFNQKMMEKLLRGANLTFHHLSGVCVHMEAPSPCVRALHLF